jgi:hypothetical protein
MLTFVCLLLAGRVVAAEAQGVITRIDPEKKEIAIEGRGADRAEAFTFVFDGDTKVLFPRQAGTIADLRTGRQMAIVYETRDSQNVARFIHVRGLKPILGNRTPTPTPTVPMANEPGVTAGVLRRVGVTDREIVVIGPGASGKETETTFAVADNTTITRDGKPTTLDSLRENDAVRIRAEKRDDKLVATEIQVGAAAAAKPKSEFIPKLRLGLKIADAILQQMENKK